MLWVKYATSVVRDLSDTWGQWVRGEDRVCFNKFSEGTACVVRDLSDTWGSGCEGKTGSVSTSLARAQRVWLETSLTHGGSG